MCWPVSYREFELGGLGIAKCWVWCRSFVVASLPFVLVSPSQKWEWGRSCAVLFGSQDNANPGYVPLCLCSIKGLGPGQVSGCPEDHRDMEVGLMTQ